MSESLNPSALLQRKPPILRRRLSKLPVITNMHSSSSNVNNTFSMQYLQEMVKISQLRQRLKVEHNQLWELQQVTFENC